MCFMGAFASVAAVVGSPAVKVSVAAARRCRRVVRAVVVSHIGVPSRGGCGKQLMELPGQLTGAAGEVAEGETRR